MRRRENDNMKYIWDQPVEEINVPILEPTKSSTNNGISANITNKAKSEVSKYLQAGCYHMFQNH